jgi:hypothetical protein
MSASKGDIDAHSRLLPPNGTEEEISKSSLGISPVASFYFLSSLAS